MKKILYLLLLLGFISCSGNIDVVDSNNLTKNTGDLNIPLRKSSVPSEVSEIKIFVDNNSTFLSQTFGVNSLDEKGINIKELPRDNYLVSVQAFNADRYLMYQGESEVEIKPNQQNVVYIEMYRVTSVRD